MLCSLKQSLVGEGEEAQETHEVHKSRKRLQDSSLKKDKCLSTAQLHAELAAHGAVSSKGAAPVSCFW